MTVAGEACPMEAQRKEKGSYLDASVRTQHVWRMQQYDSCDYLRTWLLKFHWITRIRYRSKSLTERDWCVFAYVGTCESMFPHSGGCRLCCSWSYDYNYNFSRLDQVDMKRCQRQYLIYRKKHNLQWPIGCGGSSGAVNGANKLCFHRNTFRSECSERDWSLILRLRYLTHCITCKETQTLDTCYWNMETNTLQKKIPYSIYFHIFLHKTRWCWG